MIHNHEVPGSIPGPATKKRDTCASLFDFISCRSLVGLTIIRCRQQVGSLHQFIDKDERTYDDQYSQHAPEPEIASAEAVVDTARGEGIAHPIAIAVRPNEGIDEARYPREQPGYPEIVHRLLAVLASDAVDLLRHHRVDSPSCLLIHNYNQMSLSMMN